ncbi:type II toxin-antitoxin system RelE/ParE family toxin [Paradevosia shaoguanensis]|uniref:Type II toxin-antitoxin system RelE/ParE family toxin n=1 Tax=Paradevosia shaoguanensis TaxID=1335043 RepID=A0AA41QLL8_9HYPH|nr:type II toxin-antitoxin system RelE/ParE family toxin [Paradevosia shaoguanensis]KFL27694.1 hypothetical protein JP74_06355 [Devosia sp. 17-2-E-8]MCF1741586.1 type II toxin-antitoxin system RelE/ParE family toxin [Paradevosia shaoguanensis]MCI0126069.1 type II toxin-antitoxin system RelE/ParE family toxin [Paradevosia shaoguanensis]QMV03062.1 type II toxin-antitoxin system RelE/ParE family toxin [Devosia sp. D6-9]
MIEVRKTPVFTRWLSELRDVRAQARIQLRIDRVALGNLGDIKPIGGGVSELRIAYGPGYRVYVAQRGSVLVILLCGGDKSSQRSDIETAKRLAQQWEQ